jgi:HEAT repeat protein
MSLFFPPLRPHYEAALRDVEAADPKMRALAAERLGDPRGSEAVENARDRAVAGLAKLGDDADATVRTMAIGSLGKLADPRGLELVLARFSDAEGAVREAAVMAAGEIGGEQAREALRRACGHERPDVRFQAVAAYAAVAGEDARAAVSVALGDDDPLVRQSAIESLTTLGPSADACTRIARLLQDRDESVADEAAIALGQLGDERAVPRLVKLASGPRGFEAMAALGDLRAAEAGDALDALAGSLLKPLLVKAAAATALVRIGDPRGEPHFRAVFEAFRNDARTYCVEVIGELRLAAYAEAIVKMIDRPRGAEPAAIVKALARLSSRSDVARHGFESLLARTDVLGSLAREVRGTLPPPA